MRNVRELVLQSLYQCFIDPSSRSTVQSRGDGSILPEVYRKYMQGTLDIADEAQRHVTPKLSDQQWTRLHLTEQAIMILVFYELSVCHETPYRVILNEAIELAKVYGGDQSHRLINGLAEQLALQLRPQEIHLVKNAKKTHDIPLQ